PGSPRERRGALNERTAVVPAAPGSALPAGSWLGKATEQSALDPVPRARNARSRPRPGCLNARGTQMKSRPPARSGRIRLLAALLLSLAATVALAAEPPPDSLVKTFVSLRIQPEHPCAGDTVTLQLVKNGCPPCVHLRSFGYSPAESTIAGVIDWTPLC